MTIYNGFYQSNNGSQIIYIYSVYDVISKTNKKDCKLLIKFIDLIRSKEAQAIFLNSMMSSGSTEFDLKWIRLKSSTEDDEDLESEYLEQLCDSIDSDLSVVNARKEELLSAISAVEKDIKITNIAKKYGDLFVITKKDEDGNLQEIDKETLNDIGDTIFDYISDNSSTLLSLVKHEIPKEIEKHLLQKIENFGQYQIIINADKISKIIKEIK